MPRLIKCRVPLRGILCSGPRTDPSLAVMDTGPGRATGYDLDTEYDHIREHAMNAYMVHRYANDTDDPANDCEETPMFSSHNSSTERFSRQGYQSDRAATVPPTIFMNEELNDLEPTMNVQMRPKRRPFTATRVRYPITGKMSQYPFASDRSRSEHTTPIKIPKPPNSANSPATPNYSYGGGLFLRYGNKPRDFTIHPDWVSENVQIAKLTLTDRNAQSLPGRYGTYPPRRCQSAPPPQYRNPITWQ